MIDGTARLDGPARVLVETADGRSRSCAPTPCCCPPARGPASPTGAEPDGDRILTTRQCYPPPVLPEHLVVIGSGVTGVEFVHMFTTLGSKVTLIVSRQQVLPTKDPEVAAALEADFLDRGVSLLKGARAAGHRAGRRRRRGAAATTGAWSRGSHVLLAIGSMPNSEGLGLDAAGVEVDRGGYIPHQPPLPVERGPHLRRRRRVGEAAAVVGGVHAGPQGGRARHGPAHPRAPPPRLRQGRLGHLHRARDRRRRPGRGRGVRAWAARSG